MAKAKYKKGADGYFQTRIWDGTYTADGKKHRVTLRSSKSSGDLEKKVNRLKAQVEQRKAVRRSDISFYEYAKEWRRVYKASVSDATKVMYDHVLEYHLSALEDVRLQDIERIHVQMVLNNAEGKTRTQQTILLTFKQVLRSAVADRLYPSDMAEEIFRNIQPIRYKPPEKRALSASEREAIFKADLSQSDKVFIYILYGCGLRREEALALTIFDINLKKKELTVSKAHSTAYEKPVLKDPKTHNGFRTVPIPDKIFPEVESYVHKLTAANKTYLFTMRNGQPLTKSSYDAMWRRILKKLQEVCKEPITGLTAHVLRHNYCTNLCYQIPKISIKKIAQLMGDTEGVVMAVYNHMILEKEDAEGAVNDAMNF